MIEHLILILGITLTLIQCFEKWGWLDVYAAKFGHMDWLPKATCMLCFGFWISNIVAIGYCVLVHYGIEYFTLPFAAAGFINYLQTTLKK